jgi:hypothetical protein
MFLEQFQTLPNPLLPDLFLRILFIELGHISHPQHTSLNIANFGLQSFIATNFNKLEDIFNRWQQLFAGFLIVVKAM